MAESDLGKEGLFLSREMTVVDEAEESRHADFRGSLIEEEVKIYGDYPK